MANRLAGATSPYLLQHQHNPVDWWEWSPEAFEEARRRDAPVLLSVGYAACHWCHVMAHESFEDETTAAYMNQHFVNVKVDREERPDVDAVYMNATVAMTGQGGWPMTVVLDHEARPFFAGTYFPDRPRHGMPAFSQVLQALAQAWVDRREEIATSADGIAGHLRREVDLSGTEPITADDLAGAAAKALEDVDHVNGGFGGAPKFPPTMVLEFLLRHAERTGDPAARAAVDAAYEAMARGGIHDQLAGGFARYSVDAGWVVPHFEKMLYDNALLLRGYAAWATAGAGGLGVWPAEGIADFLLGELRTDEGGFAASLDADSEGEEGTFYVWTPGQLVDVLGEDDGRWAASLLGVTDAGTFERGTSTLQLRSDPPMEELERWFRIQSRLRTARETRERPARDDKVVAAWNGLAIDALARAGVAIGIPAYVDAARAAAELVWRVHWVDGRLRRVSRDGTVGQPAGVLEDYACVAGGFLALAQATAEGVWLERAGVLLDAAHELFAADDGGWFDTASDAETLVTRPRDPSDNASPSGHAAMIHALLEYAALTGSGRHRDLAESALASVRRLCLSAPRFAGWSIAAAEAALAGPLEVAVVGAPGPARDALAEAARRMSPGAVVVVAEPGAAGIPLLEGRGEVDGAPAAYVCRNLVCERPVTDPAALG